jgi:anti-sigma regulatory factor (Ser/Thr protein kinase)
MACALLDLGESVAAATYAVYLPRPDGSGLRLAVALDTPCAFTVLSEVDLADTRQPTARAYGSRRLEVAVPSDLEDLTRDVPAHYLHNPFPMAVASVPLLHKGKALGCLSVRWSRTRDQAEPISPGDLRHLARVAAELAPRLAEPDGADPAAAAPPIPLFVPPRTRGWRVSAAAGAASVTGTTALHEVKRLSARLAAVTRTDGVLATARSEVMTPFGATGLMLCRVVEGRLQVAAATGMSRADIGRVDGMPLSRTAPETDAVNLVATRYRLPDADSREGAAGAMRPRACLPLVAEGRAVGCCVLAFPPSWRGFRSDEETALVAILLGQIGQALEGVHAHEAEHAFARAVQQSLLPPTLPLRAEAALTSRYLAVARGPAVGGDWYDVLPLPDGRLGLAVGDVEGHNAQAAGLMGHLRSALLAYAMEGHDPATTLARTDHLLRVLGASRYATCCCMCLDPVTGTALVASAGHPLPLFSPAPGLAGALDVPVGPPLGLGAGHVYEQREITLEPGGVAALFTNGFLDIRTYGPDGALERLGTALAGTTEGGRANLELLADRLVNDRRASGSLDDDAVLLLMRYDGSRPGAERDVARLAVQSRDLHAVASVRHRLRAILDRWDRPDLLDDLELVLSEAVTNALVHARSDVDIRLRHHHSGGIRLEVQDSSPQAPVPAVIVMDDATNAESESGRGLLIVDALADCWGSSPAGRGKTTWIEMGHGQDGQEAQREPAGVAERGDR